MQQKKRTVKAICFSPKKHKGFIDKQAESGLPCKLTKFTPAKEDNVIWVNQTTQITDPLEASVDFSSSTTSPEHSSSPTLKVKDLEKMVIHQALNISGLILFGDNQPQSIPSKPDLIKRKGLLLDDTGRVEITLWNEQVQCIQEGFYQVEGIRLRQYRGIKFLSCEKDVTNFKEITENLPNISQEDIEKAKDTLKQDEVACDKIQTTEIKEFYTCPSCAKKVPFEHDTKMLRCLTCRCRFLITNASKTTTARIQIIDNDNQKVWYTLFTQSLETILNRHNKETNENLELKNIDEDKLCMVILTIKGMKFYVKGDAVTNVFFD